MSDLKKKTIETMCEKKMHAMQMNKSLS